MYFLRGKLPWQGLKAKTKKEKYAAILQKKAETPLRTLCHGFPAQMEEYLRYCRSLKFEESPDYNYLRGLFHDVLVEQNLLGDTEYDWIKRKRQENAQRKAAAQMKADKARNSSSRTGGAPRRASGR